MIKDVLNEEKKGACEFTKGKVYDSRYSQMENEKPCDMAQNYCTYDLLLALGPRASGTRLLS
jgi:hypothetical protein